MWSHTKLRLVRMDVSQPKHQHRDLQKPKPLCLLQIPPWAVSMLASQDDHWWVSSCVVAEPQLLLFGLQHIHLEIHHQAFWLSPKTPKPSLSQCVNHAQVKALHWMSFTLRLALSHVSGLWIHKTSRKLTFGYSLWNLCATAGASHLRKTMPKANAAWEDFPSSFLCQPWPWQVLKHKESLSRPTI